MPRRWSLPALFLLAATLPAGAEPAELTADRPVVFEVRVDGRWTRLNDQPATRVAVPASVHGDVRVRVENQQWFGAWRGERSMTLSDGMMPSTLETAWQWQGERLALLGLGVLAWPAGIVWRSRRRPPPAPSTSFTGQRIRAESQSEYVIRDPIGRGGMGVVYEAVPTAGGESVAVKFLFAATVSEDEAVERFQREIALAARLTHPHIVRVLDWGTHGDAVPFMVMERVQGQDLRRLLKQGLSLDSSLRWGTELLEAVSVAHQAGIVHRDIKPSNVMITDTGSVKLMDFGMAVWVDGSHITQSNVAVGTPAYMSPEHLNAKHATPASDLYSLGCVLYHMLSGRMPNDIEALDVWAIMALRLKVPPTPLQQACPAVPTAISDFVMRLLDIDPERRYPSATEALQAWLLVTKS